MRNIIFSAFFLALILSPKPALNSTFEGGDVYQGLVEAEKIKLDSGGEGVSIRTTVLKLIFRVLSFMGVIAVAVIVIAGIYLIVGGGSDSSKQNAQQMIIYTLLGLLVIGISSAFVHFIIDAGTK